MKLMKEKWQVQFGVMVSSGGYWVQVLGETGLNPF